MQILNTFEFESYHEGTDVDAGLLGLENVKLIKSLGIFVYGSCWDVVWINLEKGTATFYLHAGDEQEDVSMKIGLTQLHY